MLEAKSSSMSVRPVARAGQAMKDGGGRPIEGGIVWTLDKTGCLQRVQGYLSGKENEIGLLRSSESHSPSNPLFRS